MGKIQQRDRIIDYMNENGSINQLDALKELGIMRLASRISDLRRLGYPIGRRMIQTKNRYGETVHFASYYLEDTDGQKEIPAIC